MAEKKVENFYHERNEAAAAVAFELWRGSSHFSYKSVDESGSSHIFCHKKVDKYILRQKVNLAFCNLLV